MDEKLLSKAISYIFFYRQKRLSTYLVMCYHENILVHGYK